MFPYFLRNHFQIRVGFQLCSSRSVTLWCILKSFCLLTVAIGVGNEISYFLLESDFVTDCECNHTKKRYIYATQMCWESNGVAFEYKKPSANYFNNKFRAVEKMGRGTLVQFELLEFKTFVLGYLCCSEFAFVSVRFSSVSVLSRSVLDSEWAIREVNKY